jgi:hypothetical protein
MINIGSVRKRGNRWQARWVTPEGATLPCSGPGFCQYCGPCPSLRHGPGRARVAALTGGRGAQRFGRRSGALHRQFLLVHGAAQRGRAAGARP